jgi:hypothetical protein
MSFARFTPSLLVSTSLAVALVATGCGRSTSPSAPTSGTTSELTQQAADDIARQFSSSLARQGGIPIDRVGATSLTSVATGQAAELRRSGAARIHDEGGFSWWFSITFFDAAGSEQSFYDPATTARARVHARARGHLITAEHQAAVGVERLLDVQGLLPTETTLEIDGAAHDTADCSFEALDGSAEREYHLLAAGALVDVRQLKDSSVNPYPLSGKARWDVAVDALERDDHGTREAHLDVTVTITFNGTRHPTIEIDSRYRYSGDLETGEVHRLPT